MRFALILILIPILLNSIEFAVPEIVYAADIVDIDNDNDLDIVIASLVAGQPEPPDSLTFLKNNGYGEFTKSVIAKQNFAYLKIVDIDCDGLLDICTKNSPDYQLVYYRNLGNLQFDEATIIPVEYTYVFQYPKFNDMDNDGDMDIVINYGGSSHSCNLLINNGAGTFIEDNIAYYDDDNIVNFNVGDVNCDGYGDILITTNHKPYLVLNNMFEFVSLEIDSLHWSDPFFADMDSDFDLDIILNIDLPSLSKIFINNGEGDYNFSYTIEMPLNSKIKDISDYNNDGYPDFAIQTDSEPPNVYICFNNGDGTINEPIAYTFGSVYSFIVKSADFDGNGFVDLVVTGYNLFDGIDGTSILFNDGEGNFVDEPQVGIDEEFIVRNEQCQLSCHPNPFNPSTTISYDLPVNITNPVIEIFNIKGEKVRTFNCKNQIPIIWDGTDNFHNQVSSGIYLYRIKSDEGVLQSKKMLLLK